VFRARRRLTVPRPRKSGKGLGNEYRFVIALRGDDCGDKPGNFGIRRGVAAEGGRTRRPDEQLDCLVRVEGRDLAHRFEQDLERFKRSAAAKLGKADGVRDLASKERVVDERTRTVRKRDGIVVRTRDARAPRGSDEATTSCLCIPGQGGGSRERLGGCQVSRSLRRTLSCFLERPDDTLVRFEHRCGQMPGAAVVPVSVPCKRFGQCAVGIATIA
jgi:hypothetical protein